MLCTLKADDSVANDCIQKATYSIPVVQKDVCTCQTVRREGIHRKQISIEYQFISRDTYLSPFS